VTWVSVHLGNFIETPTYSMQVFCTFDTCSFSGGGIRACLLSLVIATPCVRIRSSFLLAKILLIMLIYTIVINNHILTCEGIEMRKLVVIAGILASLSKDIRVKPRYL